MRYFPNLCRSCKHLRDPGDTCAAFPKGIPNEIRVFGVDHRTPIAGDRGVQHLLDPSKSEDYDNWARNQKK